MKFVSCHITAKRFPSTGRICASAVYNFKNRSYCTQFIFSGHTPKATFSTTKSRMSEQIKKTVLVPIANGTEEIEAVSIIDTLRRAQADVTVASVEKQLNVVCSRGVKIEADALITDCVGKDYDLIVLPGGMPGASNLKENAQLKELLQNQKQQNKYYGAICAAPAVVLQSHGLINGKNATCHPNFVKDLTNNTKVDSRVVVDGNLVTSRAPGTSLEFALTLVELLYGKETAKKVAEPMLLSNWS